MTRPSAWPPEFPARIPPPRKSSSTEAGHCVAPIARSSSARPGSPSASSEAQVDWAEVVFENGEAQVVDFAEKTHGPGLYELLDFRDGRKVDHVRMVARAKGDEARITLLLEK